MDTQEGAPAVRNHGPTGDGTMQMATTLRRSTHTFLTHLFRPGLDDDRYVIERFQSKADGEIRPRRRNGSSKMLFGSEHCPLTNERNQQLAEPIGVKRARRSTPKL